MGNSAIRQTGSGTLVLAGLLTVLVALLSILGGAAELSFSHLRDAFSAGLSQQDVLILWELRLPRSLIALLIGAQLAVSGCLLQAVLRNPLADPAVLGISSGAVFAVMVFLLFTTFSGQSDSSQLFALPLTWIPWVAQLGGVGTVVLLYSMAWRNGALPHRLVLLGIALGAGLHAAAMGILAGWGTTRVEILLGWLTGSLYGKGWEQFVVLWPWSVLSLVCLPLVYGPLRVLALGDLAASSLGLAVEKWRFALILLATVMASSAVAIAGPVAFIGLLVPHIARRIVGSQSRYYVPLAAFCGAQLAMGGDLLGRILIAPDEVPLGAITALIGAPFFIYLLSRGQKA